METILRSLFSTFLVVITLVVLFGCGSKETDRQVATLVPKPAPKPVQPKPVVRTLGSLWSADSRWNEMYSVPVARVAGDTVHVTVTDALKERIIARIPVEPAKEKKEDQPKEPNRDISGQKTYFEHKLEKTSDTKGFDVMIREVLPRSVYQVYGSEVMSVNGKQVLLTLEGNVREQDVQPGDTIASDALFNLKFEIETPQSEKK